nr:hypothetical protein CFP56_42058 [Quercus suber]
MPTYLARLKCSTVNDNISRSFNGIKVAKRRQGVCESRHGRQPSQDLRQSRVHRPIQMLLRDGTSPICVRPVQVVAKTFGYDMNVFKHVIIDVRPVPMCLKIYCLPHQYVLD